MIGQTVAHYRVLEKIGQGGMGEVYLAEDTNLNRQVAIKVLPELLSKNTESLARFEREAQLLATLNHSNIATIYGLQEVNGKRFIAMELVEGETLAERLKRGALPVEEALKIAKQIAEGLEAAHEKGVIHRDLKPANIKVTPGGKVKILDFGLAKVFEDDTPTTDLSHSPTLTDAATQAGVLLGTAAYMSPEQAQGLLVDKGTDIFVFGALLFECLTGQRAFQGKTITATLGAIIHKEPNWRTLPKYIPWRIRLLLEECLQKDFQNRLHDASNLRIQIKRALNEREAAPWMGIGSTAQIPFWKRALSWALAAVAFVVALTAIWRPTTQPISRLTVTLNEQLGSSRALLNPRVVAVSPDGTGLVYVTPRGIYLRPMDSLQGALIPGTEEATEVFFSPDGQWVGFTTDSELKKVSISGGVPLTVCSAVGLRGASWASDDNIVFGQRLSGLFQVSAGGGTPRVLTTLDSEAGETEHHYPHALPDGRAVIFTASTTSGIRDDQIVALEFETGQRKVLVSGSDARYVSTGHLVYAQAATPGTLLAVPFDLEQLRIEGSPVPILEGVVQSSTSGVVQFSFSQLGTLAYVPGIGGTESDLVWVNREGTVESLPAPPHAYRSPRLSPNGERIAVAIQETQTDIWIYEVPRQTLTRFTFEGSNLQPQWKPDGERIVWRSIREGVPGNLFWKLADGTGPVERLTTSEFRQNPSSWSPDGQLLAFFQRPSTGFSPTQRDIWILPLEGPRDPTPILQTQFNEIAPVFSPDGRWFAYSADESGRNEVFVRPFPEVEQGKWQISTGGGVEAVWARNGRELFYRNESGDQMMAVEISTAPAFSAGTPRLLFEGNFRRGASAGAFYDVTPDGERFLMVRAAQEGGANQINIVLNWHQELLEKVPVK